MSFNFCWWLTDSLSERGITFPPSATWRSRDLFAFASDVAAFNSATWLTDGVVDNSSVSLPDEGFLLFFFFLFFWTDDWKNKREIWSCLIVFHFFCLQKMKEGRIIFASHWIYCSSNCVSKISRHCKYFLNEWCFVFVCSLMELDILVTSQIMRDVTCSLNWRNERNPILTISMY